MLPKDTNPAEKPIWPFAREVSMFAAMNGQWAKKIKGRRYHFGPWADPKAALARYKAQIGDILAERTETPKNVITVLNLAAEFMYSKTQQVKAGELSARMHQDYRRVCDLMVECLGADRLVASLTATDFSRLRSKMAPSKIRRANEITWTRTVFKWAYESDLLDRPAKFGPDFKRPKAGDIRKIKNARGKKRLYSPDEIQKLVATAPPMLKACILLAINGGFGNTDCSALKMADLNLDAAIIDTIRNKTGFLRTVPLWPETVDAIRDWFKVRPKPHKEHADLVFLSASALPLVRITTTADEENKDALHAVKVDAIAYEFASHAKACGLPGRCFYDLRHTFRTVAESGAFKERTISRIMGHIQAGIGTEYIHDFSISKLQEVTNHVRNWYLNKPSETSVASTAAASPPASPPAPPAATA